MNWLELEILAGQKEFGQFLAITLLTHCRAKHYNSPSLKIRRLFDELPQESD
jgi:hypothetical protein